MEQVTQQRTEKAVGPDLRLIYRLELDNGKSLSAFAKTQLTVKENKVFALPKRIQAELRQKQRNLAQCRHYQIRAVTFNQKQPSIQKLNDHQPH